MILKKTSLPLTSIIVPVFNREEIIKDTLRSIQHQSYKNWECIIVDDHSTDNTINTIRSMVSNDERFRIVTRPSNFIKGANSCRNYGLEIARGDWINWFDSDDIMHPEFLRIKCDKINEVVEAIVHKNRYGNYTLTEFRESKFNYHKKELLFNNYALEYIELQTCSFMWKKDYLKNKKLFDPFIERYQDNEFHLRMLALQPNIIFVDDVLATIKSGNNHESQISHENNITAKKIFDVFYCRYQSLLLAKQYNLKVEPYFYNKLAKKSLWSYYAGLKKAAIENNRKKFTSIYRDQLKFILSHKELSYLDKLKAQVNLFRLKYF